MLQEFKDFALKGNVVDMAIGIVIGAAFTSIVTALVDGIMMPIVGFVTGGVDFSDIFTNLGDGDYASLAAAKEAGAPVIQWGVFVNALIAFLIVAWILFLIVKGMNRMKREEAEVPADEPSGPTQEELLTDIRDLLSKQSA